MNIVLSLKDRERAELFAAAAQNLGFAPVIVEKDFWACWALCQLFKWPGLTEHLIFKGGTSLSKIWKAIRRFSEDLDVSLGRELLGFAGDQDPAHAKSATKRRQQLEALNEACQEKIRTLILPGLKDRVQKAVGGGDAEVTISPDDPMTLLFRYPSVATNEARGAYVPRVVKIECGARADAWPAEQRSLQPYVADAYPDRITDADVSVRVLSAERTFWEKATILHAEAFRDAAKPTPLRYSRHYADLATLSQQDIGRNALARGDIRVRVVKHKKVFFEAKWAKYDLAVPGSFRLLPDARRLADLERDYRDMREMFFDEPSSWAKVVDVLRDLERTINTPTR